ncbi:MULTISPECIES: hypothetical protein, partial [unclassified Streptomyces]|uniref:hypothetical protein n=1 Tax=unclassified Streptomyces TaxID=2593676 RepID=UPI0035D87EBC
MGRTNAISPSSPADVRRVSRRVTRTPTDGRTIAAEPCDQQSVTAADLEVISFGEVGRLSVMVGIVERLVPDELWELF